MKTESNINVHFKICKSNFFLIVSTGLGNTLLSINSGYLGFKNIQKRSNDALNKLLIFGVKYISSLKGHHSVFFHFENVKKTSMVTIYKLFIKKLKFNCLGFSLLNKIPHNVHKK